MNLLSCTKSCTVSPECSRSINLSIFIQFHIVCHTVKSRAKLRIYEGCFWMPLRVIQGKDSMRLHKTAISYAATPQGRFQEPGLSKFHVTHRYFLLQYHPVEVWQVSQVTHITTRASHFLPQLQRNTTTMEGLRSTSSTHCHWPS